MNCDLDNIAYLALPHTYHHYNLYKSYKYFHTVISSFEASLIISLSIVFSFLHIANIKLLLINRLNILIDVFIIVYNV